MASRALPGLWPLATADRCPVNVPVFLGRFCCQPTNRERNAFLFGRAHNLVACAQFSNNFFNIRLTPPDGKAAYPACEIVSIRTNRKAAAIQNPADAIRLSRADFEDRDAFGGQQAPDMPRQVAIRIHPIPAAVQRRTRLVSHHLRRERGDRRGWNIRRIGNNQIEPSGDAVSPVALNEARTF